MSDPLRTAVLVAQIAAAVSAVVVARQRPRYWSVAALLLFDVTSSFARAQFVTKVMRPAKLMLAAQGIDPLASALPSDVVVAGHIEHALYLGWPAGLALLAVAVFLREEGAKLSAVAAPMLFVGLGWACANAVLILGYEHHRGHAAQAVYLPATAGALLIGAGSFIQWRWRRRSTQVEHWSAAMLLALEVLSAAVTFPGLLTERWPLARVCYLGCYLVLIVIHGGALCWWSRQRSS